MSCRGKLNAASTRGSVIIYVDRKLLKSRLSVFTVSKHSFGIEFSLPLLNEAPSYVHPGSAAVSPQCVKDVAELYRANMTRSLIHFTFSLSHSIFRDLNQVVKVSFYDPKVKALHLSEVFQSFPEQHD